MTVPELRDADYVEEVFSLSLELNEVYLNKLLLKGVELGISFPRPYSISMIDHETLGTESSATPDGTYARTSTTDSQASASTSPSSHSSVAGHGHSSEDLTTEQSHNLTFAQYDSYLSKLNSKVGQSRLSTVPKVEPTTGRFGATTSKSYKILRESIAKLRDRKKPGAEVRSCSACREDVQSKQRLQKLPCGHSYCSACLRTMINQATTEEASMPPRCCTQAIPTKIIKSILSLDEQTKFLKAVQQFSTPWEARIFCSNLACGEFIPPCDKVDPKHPSKIVCRICRTPVCAMCKKDAHPFGQDCPDDWELDAVLKMGERSGWRRCYKCRTLVELAYGCTHITCRCRAEFCYICGAVWDPVLGCLNLCNGDDELERRREEEEARIAALELEEAKQQQANAREEAEEREAEARTRSCPEFKGLRGEQVKEMERFSSFEQKSKWLLWTRHTQQKQLLIQKHSAAARKMLERHAKISANLEDRQVAAEMELRDVLEQREKYVRVRLKHMEAYCDELGQKPSANMPERVVTERDLRELGQQYTIEKNMKQLHQSKINVLRDRQAKDLEQLIERQESEIEILREKNAKDVERLEVVAGDEEDSFTTTFYARRSMLETRWALEMEILRTQLGNEQGKRYTLLPPLEWPAGVLGI
ncbi:hypothetical protein F4808DRAFT_450118 [Astrocystis sublimbata]|nr:hypothetical protein F4808DRAFT_450118 [Astrocystis sublimbata]